MTGVPEDNAVLREKGVKADAWMIKPFDMNELLDTMPRLVSTHQFKITSLANLYARRLDPSKTFTVLWELMKRMFREGHGRI